LKKFKGSAVIQQNDPGHQGQLLFFELLSLGGARVFLLVNFCLVIVIGNGAYNKSALDEDL